MALSLASAAGELPLSPAASSFSALGEDRGLQRWTSIGAASLLVGSSTGFFAASIAWLGSSRKNQGRNALWAGLLAGALGGTLQFVAQQQATRDL